MPRGVPYRDRNTAREREPRQPGITSRAHKAVNKLAPKRRIYVRARFDGASVAQAAEAAGVSKRMGSNYEHAKDVQAAYRELMSKAIPPNEIVKLVKGGCHATMPIFGPDGKKKKEVPDWRARKPYIDMAREDAGYVEKKSDATGTLINVTVQHIGGQTGVKVGGSQPIIEAPAQAKLTP